MWCPKPRRFNDPFDCGIDLWPKMTKGQCLEVLHNIVKQPYLPKGKNRAELRDFLDVKGELSNEAMIWLSKCQSSAHNARDNSGIISLSATDKSILMWSHYAARHSGMCVAFRIPRSPFLQKVKYRLRPPRFTLHDILIEPDKGTEKLFTVKHADWKYEKEWRIWDSEGGRLVDIPGPIISITLGMRTSPEHEKLVRAAAEQASQSRIIRIRKCNNVSGSFGVEVTDA